MSPLPNKKNIIQNFMDCIAADPTHQRQFLACRSGASIVALADRMGFDFNFEDLEAYLGL